MYVCVGVMILFCDTKISQVYCARGIPSTSQNIGRFYITVDIVACVDFLQTRELGKGILVLVNAVES